MNRIPTDGQRTFQDWEFGVFFHFGIRSFFKGHTDWDGRPMPAEAFNPKELDCDKWISTAATAGAKYAILVCKHHDGFANWPTRFSDYSVRSAPWKNGQGDVVREYVDACRRHNLKVGLYYSPAQWGGNVSFDNAKDYDDYFIAQIGELLTGYGKIDYLWFDFCGSENHQYDHERIIAEIRRMQPEVLLIGRWDPNTRWIGNEGGYANDPNDNYVKGPFLPAECDCMMRDTWFDCADNEDAVKSVEELMGMYEYSVGRGANLLLNIGPDFRGLLPEKDAARLLEFGNEVRRRYGNPLPFEMTSLPDGRPCITAQTPLLVDRLVLSEDVTNGQNVEHFRIMAHPLHCGQQEICVYEGCTIGHKRICIFPCIKADRFTIELQGAEGAKLAAITAHCAAQ